MDKQEAKEIAAKNLRELQTALENGHSENLKAYLRAIKLFPNYSLRNLMMIMKQAPHATAVNGFHTWRKLGRSVRKGEKGIGVFAPMIGIGKEDSEHETEGERYPFGFRLVHVFDISQTAGQDLPQLAKPAGFSGEYIQRLESVFNEHSIEVVEQELPAGTSGRSYGGKIAVAPNQSDTERFQVLIHELAHELMHRNLDARPTHSVRETEAESVAYAVCSACGIECLDHASDYIGMVQGDSEQFCGSLQAIFKTSSYLIQELIK